MIARIVPFAVLLVACGPKQPTSADDSTAARVSEGEPVVCQTSGDCPPPAECLRPEGRVVGDGICGTVVDARGLPVGTGSTQLPGCFSSADCPDFDECFRFANGDGVCIDTAM